MRIYLTETKVPQGGASFYRSDFRTLPLNEIENILQEDMQAYSNVGYNSFTFHRSTGTVNIRKVEIKTIEDIFITDQYGLLNQ